VALGVLRVDVAAHEEAYRLDVQLLADVLADPPRRSTTGAIVGSSWWLVSMRDSSSGNGRADLDVARGRLGWLAQGIQLSLQGCDIRRHRLAQQFRLDRIHTLGPSRERHLAQSLIFASLNAMA
jgi:hypothetical protein